MTTKQRLHELVDALDEAAADRLLAAALALTPSPQPGLGSPGSPGPALAAFIGSGNSGRGDLGRRHREIRAEATRGLAARDL